MVMAEIVEQRLGTFYLTPTEERTNLKGVKVLKDGKWVDIKELKVNDKVSIDGLIYIVTDSKTNYSLTLYEKYSLKDGKVIYNIGDSYILLENGRQTSISKSRFKQLTSGLTPELVIQPSSSALELSKKASLDSKPSSKQADSSTPKQATLESSTTPQGTSSKQTSSNLKSVLFLSSILYDSTLYPRDNRVVTTPVKEVLDQLPNLRETLKKATGISDLSEIENLTLADLLSARENLEALLKSRNPTKEELDKLINKYGKTVILFLIRTYTGDKELELNELYQALDYLNSLEYRKRVQSLNNISSKAEELLNNKSWLERYYFVKYLYSTLMSNINGMSYVENGERYVIDFNNPGKKEQLFLNRLLEGNFNNNYLSYKYGVPFLAKISSSFDNFIASVEVVERLMLGIANSVESLGLNRLEQYRYYSEELPRIVAGLYSNYAAAIDININRGLSRFFTSPRGLNFQELMSVGEIIKNFVDQGKGVELPADGSFRVTGKTRVSPQVRVPDPELITQGILLNITHLATRYNRRAGYFFNLSGNTWEELRANLYYEATQSGARGTGRAELVGTTSRIIAEVNGEEISFIARNIELLDNRINSRVSFSPKRVEAELEAELDSRFRGANVGVVFRRLENRFEGILYAKIDGNWYRLGYVDNGWLLGMDVLIPGFAAALAEVKVGETGVVGSVGIAMPSLSGYVVKTENDLKAIAAYLLNGNQLAAGAFLDRNVTAPNLVYAGFYNNNIILGGQYLSRDFTVSGYGVVGNGLGVEITLGTRGVVASGTYMNLDGVSQIAAGVKTSLNGYDIFLAYGAMGDSYLLAGGFDKGDLSLQLFRLSRVNPSIFGPYARFFQNTLGISGAYAAFGGGYLEGILSDDMKLLLGGGIKRDSFELNTSIGIGGQETLVAGQVSIPLGVWLASIGALYQENSLMFAGSLENSNWFLGFAHKEGANYLKVRYRDQDRMIGVYSSLKDGSIGVLGEYGFWLNEGLFANIKAGIDNGETLGYYLGAGVKAKDIQAELGYGGYNDKYRFLIRARAVYRF